MPGLTCSLAAAFLMLELGDAPKWNPELLDAMLQVAKQAKDLKNKNPSWVAQ
jgi:hypothetical protein